MKTNQIIAASLMMISAILAGCAGTSRPAGTASTPGAVYSSALGTIDSIQVVQGSTGSTSGVGTVTGGVVGGALGNQVGEGRGRTAATVAGAVGGAMIGNQMEKNMGSRQIYQIGVRLDNGSYQTFQQESIGDLQVGNRVRIENGVVYRY